MKTSISRWLFAAVLTLALSYYVSNNWYSVMMIQGDSMIPSYHDKQFVILDRHSNAFSYGDVVAFQCENLSSVLVKRIAACPGDRVSIEDGTLYLNGQVSKVYPDTGTFSYAGILEQGIQLEEGEYVVIGDNIDASKDSRYEVVGRVKRKDIIGEIVVLE